MTILITESVIMKFYCITLTFVHYGITVSEELLSSYHTAVQNFTFSFTVTATAFKLALENCMNSMVSTSVPWGVERWIMK